MNARTSIAVALIGAAVRRNQREHPDGPLAAADLIALSGERDLLVEASGELSYGDTTWAVKVVHGELSLRAALLEEGRIVVVLPASMAVPHDIGQRRWLRRSIRIQAEDVVAAATGVMCQPFTDPTVADAVLEDVPGFFERAQRRRWHGPSIREGEVIGLLQTERRDVGRHTASELLARWLVDGPPGDAPMLRAALRDAHFEVHDWLTEASTPQGLQALVTAGALGPCPRTRSVTGFKLPPDADKAWQRLIGLTRQAISAARPRAPEAVERWLEPAERLVRQLDLDFDEASQLTLLRAGFDAALTALTFNLARGQTPDQAAFDRLELNAFADSDAIEVVEALARLTRFAHGALPEPPIEATPIAALAVNHRDDSAWGDVCARIARRGCARLPESAQSAALTILDAYRARRDRLNRAFATALAADETHAYRRQTVGDGMSLHLTSGGYVTPLVEQGGVLLVVLDGCDFAAFYEVLADLRTDARLGLGRAKHLSGAAKELPTLVAALSPLPTLTQVGRRAIFAGQIPENDTFTDQEHHAANASNDHTAFRRNTALADHSRELFLKDTLHDGGAALLTAIESDTHVVAVVFNGIDDQLESRETTLHTCWRADHVHPALRKALLAAVRTERSIVLTADHGHTSFWGVERKVKAGADSSQRFTRGHVPPGAVTFGGTPWRAGLIHLMSDMGAYVSVQRAGYHGGAGLEEVVVPLALLAAEGAAAPRPEWWSHVQARLEIGIGTSVTPTYAVDDHGDVDMGEEVIEAWQAEVRKDVVPLIRFLDDHGQITEADVARLANRRAWRRLDRALKKLREMGLLEFDWQRNSHGGMARIVKRTES